MYILQTLPHHIFEKMYISLSPKYTVRNERSTSYLIRVDKIIDADKNNFGVFCIPPFMGYILAHVGDKDYSQSLVDISDHLGISSKSIDVFVQQIVNNPMNKEFKIDNHLSVILPQFLLTTNDNKIETNLYEESAFDGLGDYKIERPSAPISANLMVTTKCSTDCIYCYANRNLAPLMSTEKLIQVIDELYSLGTVNLTLTGGDIFAHPDWIEILKRVREYGYKPFLSTKTPLTIDQIEWLRNLGYEEIQFSLDSVDSTTLKTMVGANTGYLGKVVLFLENCSRSNLNVLIRSVLTKLNASSSNIQQTYEFLKRFQCVKEWVMTPAFFSVYKKDEYKHLEVNNDDLIDAYEFSTREDLAFRIGLNKISENGYLLKKHNTAEEYVCRNQICMGNTTCLSILANGDCSVCEMLYDNPEYLLGNVVHSSIADIWNSEKALSLYEICQKNINPESPCSDCIVFDKCRRGFGKRVCYLDISKTGHSKDFPDPRCPQAEECKIIL